jgi:hypothetical protein
MIHRTIRLTIMAKRTPLPPKGWIAFEVGNSRSFAKEVEQTGKNKALMKFLAERRQRGKGAAIPLEEVKRRLGIE